MENPGSRLDMLEAAMVVELSKLAATDQLTVGVLSEDEAERPTAGSRPACIVKASDGSRYFFKSAPSEHVAAEVLAYRMRTLGKRPILATAARSLTLPSLGPVKIDGMLQPLLSHAGERLSTRPTDWSPEQCEVMLREHPWEWLLGNLDTHIDQYVLYGDERLPFNIDWDHALLDLDVETLDRFTKRSPAVAPIRNALYDAFTAGIVGLDFSGMRREVRRIARLDDAQLRRFMTEWESTRGANAEPKDATRVIESFFRRKRRIGKVFGRFVRSLVRERRHRRAGVVALPDRVRTAVLDSWQRFVIDTLHDRAVVPWLRVYRRVLAVKDRLPR